MINKEIFKQYVENLIVEQIYGKQTFVYHGSKSQPEDIIGIMKDEYFKPGAAMYGRGFYSIYELEPGYKTLNGEYGNYLYKFKVKVLNFISFDKDIAIKIWGKDLTIYEQLIKIGIDEEVLKNALLDYSFLNEPLELLDGYTAKYAHEIYSIFLGKANGVFFYGEQDGPVCIIYDTSLLTPFAWTKIEEKQTEFKWNKFEESDIKQTIKKTSWKDPNPEKFNKIENNKNFEYFIKKIKYLSDEQLRRIIKKINNKNFLHLLVQNIENIDKRHIIEDEISNKDDIDILRELAARDNLSQETVNKLLRFEDALIIQSILLYHELPMHYYIRYLYLSPDILHLSKHSNDEEVINKLIDLKNIDDEYYFNGEKILSRSIINLVLENLKYNKNLNRNQAFLLYQHFYDDTEKTKKELDRRFGNQ